MIKHAYRKKFTAFSNKEKRKDIDIVFAKFKELRYE